MKSVLGLAFGAALLCAPLPSEAASTDVVFHGGIAVYTTTGCDGWDPAGSIGYGTYFVPVAGSTNGTQSTLTFHFGYSAEAFTRDSGKFVSEYRAVTGTHIYTRAGEYDAFLKVTRQVPSTITTTTKNIRVVGFVKGWDRDPDCEVKFELEALKHPNP